jgi:aspartyl/glutamyl-tRNA(Asn/Gln) amidotransferase C subunit
MKIDREEAQRIARLAHLELDDAALVRMAEEMTKILSYIDQLSSAGFPAGDEETGLKAGPTREDVPRPSIDRALAERNAPQWSEGFFVVPKVIGGE